MPRNRPNSQLIAMMRDISAKIDLYRSLAGGLLVWQWNVFGLWHFGQEEDVHFNVFRLREDRLTTPDRTGRLWRPDLDQLGTGCFKIEPAPVRSPLPNTVLHHLVNANRRQAEPLVRTLSMVQPWKPTLTEVKVPLIKHGSHGRSWSRRSAIS